MDAMAELCQKIRLSLGRLPAAESSRRVARTDPGKTVLRQNLAGYQTLIINSRRRNARRSLKYCWETGESVYTKDRVASSSDVATSVQRPMLHIAMHNAVDFQFMLLYDSHRWEE